MYTVNLQTLNVLAAIGFATWVVLFLSIAFMCICIGAHFARR